MNRKGIILNENQIPQAPYSLIAFTWYSGKGKTVETENERFPAAMVGDEGLISEGYQVDSFEE